MSKLKIIISNLKSNPNFFIQNYFFIIRNVIHWEYYKINKNIKTQTEFSDSNSIILISQLIL